MRADFNMIPPPTLHSQHAMRATLLQFFIDCSSMSELTKWLESIGESIDGSSSELRIRLRNATKFVEQDAAKLPRTAISFISRYGDEQLTYLCEILGIFAGGDVDAKVRRIMRHIGTAERWLPPKTSLEERPLNRGHIRPFVEYYLVSKDAKSLDDFSMPLIQELIEIFGEKLVHENRSVGKTVKEVITAHVGETLATGVGVLVQRPSSSAELRNLLRKAKVFKEVYADDLIVMLMPDKLDSMDRRMALSGLLAENIAVVIK